MRSLLTREIFWLVLLIVGAFLIRAWNSSEALNFSTDQAVFGSRAWEIWQNKEITFAGPTASWSYQGRYLIQSSAIFYQTLAFLLPVQFDPLASTLLMSMVASLMVIPLYFGSKLLTNKWAAALLAGLFAFAPVYVSYTRFLWNPNYQLLYTPLLILTLGKFITTRKPLWLLLSGVAAGFLMLFHYQFFIAILAISGYWLWTKIPPKNFGLWLVGVLVGLLPLIAFELKSRFYLSQTLWLLLTHRTEVTNAEPSGFPTHYFLSLSLLVLTGCFGYLTRRWPKFWTRNNVGVLIATVMLLSLIRYYPEPAQGFGMSPGWNYLLEEKAHNIIVEQDMDNFSVVNIIYETTASVQYYLLKTRQTPNWTQNYGTERHLFVIAPAGLKTFDGNPAYELSSFKPSTFQRYWELSPDYWLYLLTRD